MEKLKFSTSCIDIICLVSIGIALRSIVSLHSYSGKGKPPMYGDYEAQRHWQEVTISLNAKEWYTNSSNNDLLYWGLDYPPLTAYHSKIIGKVAKVLNPNYVELHESRGYESKEHKSFMRLSVIIADILIYIPSIVILGFTLQNVFKTRIAIAFTALMLLYPGQILIDNGHFQYNNISLGLAALAIAALLTNHNYIGAFLFTLAINYKQMELYHALPIFFYLLRKCIFGPESTHHKLKRLGFLSLIVITTFLVLWYPWLHKTHSFLSVLSRLFPINRGVFEDKVANFWCVLNVAYKIKNIFSNELMALVCLIITAAVVLPINIRQFFIGGKSQFLLALTNTALAFFMFSFQVHEKSILLAALPMSCLIVLEQIPSLYMLQVTSFSMLPLLIKDGLIIPYYSMFLIFYIVIRICIKGLWTCPEHKIQLYDVSTMFLLLFSQLVHILPSPSKYPFLWPLLISIYSFLNIFIFFLYQLYIQFRK